MSIPVFVISLPDCADRRRRISGCLDGLGLSFDFVDAVDGRNGIPDEFESMIDRGGGAAVIPFSEPPRMRPLTDSEFGCALSHILVYKMIVERGIPYALVFEDDAIPGPDLVRYLRERHFEDADLTILYYAKTWVKKKGAKRVFGGYRSFPCVPGTIMKGAVAYVISIAGARHIAESSLRVKEEADWPACADIFRWRGRWRAVYPQMVDHGGRDSIIDSHGRYTDNMAHEDDRSRRLLGVHIPTWRRTLKSWRTGIGMRVLGYRRVRGKRRRPHFHSEAQHRP